jgi:hypothetical protein
MQLRPYSKKILCGKFAQWAQLRRSVSPTEGWSGRVDLNHRPPGPEPGALARLSHAPTVGHYESPVAIRPALQISLRCPLIARNR